MLYETIKLTKIKMAVKSSIFFRVIGKPVKDWALS